MKDMPMLGTKSELFLMDLYQTGRYRDDKRYIGNVLKN
jgi:hypothetical protein